MDNTKSKKKKNNKIRYKSIVLLLVFLGIITLIMYEVCNIRLKNIYITGNKYLSDQEIIDSSRLGDYPKVVNLRTKEIKNNLKENIYIKDVKIKYKNFRQEINIEVEENIPALYYKYEEKTVLTDGSMIDKQYDLPILINQTPEELLNKLVKKLENLNKDVYLKISEIKYSPNKVDSELFRLTMNDGYYVFINFNSFNKLNNYIEIVKSFNNKKGILHLDSGNYLEVYKETKTDNKIVESNTNNTSNKSNQ